MPQISAVTYQADAYEQSVADEFSYICVWCGKQNDEQSAKGGNESIESRKGRFFAVDENSREDEQNAQPSTDFAGDFAKFFSVCTRQIESSEGADQQFPNASWQKIKPAVGFS